MGIWLALKITKPKIERVVVEKEIYIEKNSTFVFNDTEMLRLGVSKGTGSAATNGRRIEQW